MRKIRIKALTLHSQMQRRPLLLSTFSLNNLREVKFE